MTGIALSLQIALHSVDILSLLIHGNKIYFDMFVPSLISYSNIMKF